MRAELVALTGIEPDGWQWPQQRLLLRLEHGNPRPGALLERLRVVSSDALVGRGMDEGNAEVRVADVAAPAPQPATSTSGLICIEFPGGVRVSVDGSVDAGALARVLSVLR